MPDRNDEQNAVDVIVITGTVGVGKSSTASALADLLEELDIPNAMIDMDYLRWVSHRPADDPHHARLGLRNLAAVAANCREAGARVFVIPDVVEDGADRAHYEAAIPGAQVRIVRLRLPLTQVEARLRARERGESLRWHLRRAPELDAIMDVAAIGQDPRDLIVELGDRPSEEIAREIVARIGVTA